MKKIAIICRNQEDFDNFIRDNYIKNDDKLFIPVYKDYHVRMFEFIGILNTYHPMIDDPRGLKELCISRIKHGN